MFSLHIDSGRGWRGAQRQTMYTVVGLREIGDRAAIVAQPQSELFHRLSEGMDLFPIEIRREIDLEAAWKLSRIIKQLAPDVVHAHDLEAAGVTATALSIISAGPEGPVRRGAEETTTTGVGQTLQGPPESRPAFVMSRRLDSALARQSFSRWSYTQVDGFIATSAAIRDRLVGDGVPRYKTTVIADGVDVERIVRLPAANVHAELFLPTHAPVVGNVASLVAEKGHRYLIEAAALVLRDAPDARFVIFGNGELRGALEEQIHHRHLERHVFLAGFRPDAIELLKGCDLVAVSAIHEGTSAAVVEAMAASKAVVATSVGAVPEVVADGVTGILVRPRDAEGLGRGISRLLRERPLRERMGAAALARARERFTVERMVEATASVYARLVDTRRAADIANRAADD
jgi:glycosyltransferase involved in cell wall biosynthesis